MAAQTLLVLAFIALANGAALEKRAFSKLEVKHCGDVANTGLLTLKEVDVSPWPAVVPGDLKVTVKGSLNQDLPQLYIKADITKILLNGNTRINIPCIQGYGSCVYDICELTKNVNTCPADMIKYNIPCKCPFSKFTLGNFQESFNVNNIPALLSWLTSGDYEVRAEVMTSPTGTPIACYDVKASLISKAIDCTDPFHKFSKACGYQFG